MEINDDIAMPACNHLPHDFIAPLIVVAGDHVQILLSRLKFMVDVNHGNSGGFRDFSPGSS